MTRSSSMLALGSLVLAGACAVASTLVASNPTPIAAIAEDHETAVACLMKCGEASAHCTELARSGKGEYASMAANLRDCRDVCALLVALKSSKSTLGLAYAEGCARVCEQMAAECETMKGDSVMAECAKACRDCAAECREMAKQGAGAMPGKEHKDHGGH